MKYNYANYGFTDEQKTKLKRLIKELGCTSEVEVLRRIIDAFPEAEDLVQTNQLDIQPVIKADEPVVKDTVQEPEATPQTNESPFTKKVVQIPEEHGLNRSIYGNQVKEETTNGTDMHDVVHNGWTPGLFSKFFKKKES